MAAVSSFLHLLSFSDISPKSDHVFIIQYTGNAHSNVKIMLQMRL